ncbi:NUDIX hydrolase [Streptomyces sp. NPDC058202]|uniref:NUDIX hydrolase n=1 Tax=Streptomyces sp. NPDC058202 TaxID=3346380 RepID=UPI0036E12A7E
MGSGLGARVVDAGRVLLIRRAVAAGSLVWSCPSGKVEVGEEQVEAAVREALEEAA